MNIRQILDQLGVSYVEGGHHRNVRTGFLGCDCPRCGQGSGHHHLGIREEGRGATCWQCGPLRLGDVLVELSGRPLREVLQLLDGLESAPGRPSTASKARGRLELPSGLRALKRPHRAYLEGRGFNPDKLVRVWGIQGTGPLGPLKWRIWIPVRLVGRTVTWTTRSIGDGDGAKYVSAKPEQEELPIKSLLYGENLVRNSVVVCEGPTDVWRLGPGAVATFGVSVTPDQIDRLVKLRVTAICFDDERKARELAGTLSLYSACLNDEGVDVIRLETGNDLGDADEAEVREIRERFLGPVVQ